MTKAVRIENADNSTYKVRVRTFDKSANGEPDVLVSEQILAHPTAMTNDTTYIHSGRYIIVDEAE
jgi:hypothetical protein